MKTHSGNKGKKIDFAIDSIKVKNFRSQLLPDWKIELKVLDKNSLSFENSEQKLILAKLSLNPFLLGILWSERES